MKKLLLITLLMAVCHISSFASHFAGGEIWYQWNGTNYTVYLQLYRACQPNNAGLPQSVVVKLRSSSLGVDSAYNANLVKQEYNAPACSVSSTCFTPSSSVPGYQIYTYSTDVTVPATSADWEFSYTTGARASTVNVQNPQSQMIFIYADLDNTNGNNSSAYCPNIPPFVVGLNGYGTAFQTLDYDGDSVVYEVADPLVDSVRTAVPYLSPYSSTNPLGTNGAYYISPSGDSVSVSATGVGYYSLAYTIKEYRNGTLIASRIRDFMTTAINANNISAPRLVSGPTDVSICPGKTQNFTLGFVDSNLNDSVIITVDPIGIAGFSATFVSVNGVNNGSLLASITAPANLNPQTLPFFYINMWVYDDRCPRAANKYSILVRTQLCNADSVWPGDANNDKVVNILDPLALALAYGQTGTVRANASSNWVGQYAVDWGSNITGTATDLKHADCDGNGVVGLSDLQPMVANWGNTHPKEVPAQKTTGLPDLYFDLSGISFAPGITVDVPIMLGTGSLKMPPLYGIGARVGVAINGSAPSAASSVSHDYGWLGSAGNTLNLSKAVANGTIDWAFARTDGANTSGYGHIGTFSYTIPSTAADGDRIDMTFGEVVIIDNNGTALTGFNAVNAVAYVASLSVGDKHGLVNDVVIVPNPSSGQAVLNITLAKEQNVQVTVTDITGKQLWAANEQMNKGTQRITLPASGLPAGVYMVRVADEQGVQQTLKWVKQ